MKQLECRFYTLYELSQEIRRVRNKHFAENAKNDLTKWGYEWEWLNRRGVLITKQPETPQARLAEIMNRKFGLDIQIDTHDFACFLYLLLTDAEFMAMPWRTRMFVLKDEFGLKTTKRRLSGWASRLFKADVLHKSLLDRTYWCTYYVDGFKVQEPVAADDELLAKYMKRQSEALSEYRQMGAAKSEAWSGMRKQLWSEFECCYYSCAAYELNMIADEMDEIVDLAAAVCAKAAPHSE